MPDDSHTASVPRLTVRVGRYLPLLLLLGLVVHLILPQMTTLSHSLEVIRGMALWAMALAIVAQALSYVGNGFLLMVSQTLNGVLLPVILVVMLRLINDRRLMGNFANGRVFNALAWVIVAASIALTVILLITSFQSQFPAVEVTDENHHYRLWSNGCRPGTDSGTTRPRHNGGGQGPDCFRATGPFVQGPDCRGGRVRP